MGSILSLLMYIPFYSKKIENKYLTNFLFVIVSLLIGLTLFLNYDISNLYINDLSYNLTGLKSTKYFILLVIGLISQMVLYYNSHLNTKDYLLQVIFMLWFGLIDNSPLVLSFGFLFISMIYSISNKKDIVYKSILFFLLIITFMQESSMFNINSILVQGMIICIILLLIINLKNIKLRTFRFINYYSYITIVVFISTIGKKLEINFNNLDYLYFFAILLLDKSLYTTICRLIVYFLTLGFLVGVVDISVVAPLVLLSFLMPKAVMCTSESLSSFEKLLSVLIILVIPYVLNKSFIFFSPSCWILVLLFIPFLSISIKKIILNGLDLKNQSVQLSFGLIVVGIIIAGIEQL